MHYDLIGEKRRARNQNLLLAREQWVRYLLQSVQTVTSLLTVKHFLDDIIQRLELNDKDPAIVDITTTSAVASRLVEAKIDCLQKEKDLFLYYFVTRYPGRTIVFVNSIDAIRRLVPISKLLGLEVIGLHAQMQQKQRLKNLDRYVLAQ
jgi:superfamily II DNA/RNA helicase